MFPIQYNPKDHMIGDIPFVHHLRAHLRDPLLFTYQHRRTGNWMVAAWVKERWGRMLELLVLGRDPVGTREHVIRLECMVAKNDEVTGNRERNRRHLRTDRQRFLDSQIEDQEGLHDRNEFLGRQFQSVVSRERWAVSQPMARGDVRTFSGGGRSWQGS